MRASAWLCSTSIRSTSIGRKNHALARKTSALLSTAVYSTLLPRHSIWNFNTGSYNCPGPVRSAVRFLWVCMFEVTCLSSLAIFVPWLQLCFCRPKPVRCCFMCA
uniref:(northern house mosquito) hypothetical protein n=1 Tax=Culex pipiens TaxID=7175 RepID=A0A8D8FSB7_CULPI